ncbi:hypothetical protein [Spirosoma luteum]|uniref:hypothetical protein n=1 Tax=Spirosoma luteum TaxID=431553 RepID=UPI0003622D37|nr:hypothetical protein [Spirosoma luteum]
MKPLLIMIAGAVIIILVRYWITGPSVSPPAQESPKPAPALSMQSHLATYSFTRLTESPSADTAQTDLKSVTETQKEQIEHFAGLLDLPPKSFCFALSSVSQSDADAFMLYGLSMIALHPKKAIRYSRRLSEFYQAQHSPDGVINQLVPQIGFPRHRINLPGDFSTTTTAEYSPFRSLAGFSWLDSIRWLSLLILVGGIFGLYHAWKTGRLFLYVPLPKPMFDKQGYTAFKPS